jgi:hypothetical protein
VVILNHWQMADIVFLHQFQGLAHPFVRGDGHGIGAHDLADLHLSPPVKNCPTIKQNGGNFKEIPARRD